MGDPSSQLAHRSHFLSMPQLLFKTPALAHILKKNLATDNRPVFILKRGDVGRGFDSLVILAGEEKFGLDGFSRSNARNRIEGLLGR